jgi:hypothetical protein
MMCIYKIKKLAVIFSELRDVESVKIPVFSYFWHLVYSYILSILLVQPQTSV